MRTSEQTDKIDAALARVQAELEMVDRNKGVEVEGKTTKFATKFATIAVLYKACRALLTRERITIWQGGGFEKDGGERLYTRLAHEGQWIVSSFPVKAREGAQNFGGGIAFARRWGLAAAVGIFPADDADEQHGYAVARAETRVPKTKAPAGIALVLETIRATSAEDSARFSAVASRARAAHPTGEASVAVEQAISAWMIEACGAAKTLEQIQRLGTLQNEVRGRGAAIREALLQAERRIGMP